MYTVHSASAVRLMSKYHDRSTASCKVSRSCALLFRHLYPVYTIQPVVKPVEQPLKQPDASCEQTFNRLFNRFDNRLNVCLHDAAGCLTTVVKPPTAVEQPVVQPVECLDTRYNQLFNRLFNRLFNQFNNWLYRMNGVLELSVLTGPAPYAGAMVFIHHIVHRYQK